MVIDIVAVSDRLARSRLGVKGTVADRRKTIGSDDTAGG